MRAAYAAATGAPPQPGIVVLHELWGLNDDIRRIAERLGSAGYAAVAPDLYSPGFKPLCIARTLHSMANMGAWSVDQAEAARAWLGARPEVDANRIGAIGFCLGGGFALALGVRGDLRAAAVNYGPVPPNATELEGVCPVVASYGADDRRFAAEGQRLDALLDELGVEHDVKLYEGAVHSFMNDAGHSVLQRLLRPVMAFAYDGPAAEDAWERILAFLDRHLRSA